MPVVAFDTETKLFRPGCMAPDLVCVTWQRPGSIAQLVHQSNAETEVSTWLTADTLVGQNVAYDLAVICERWPHLRHAVFEAYRSDRVTDTMIRQQLLDVAGGEYRGRLGDKGRWITHEYTLEALAKRNTEIRLFKDGWRMSYGEFVDTPLEQWPARAREVQAAARPRVLALCEQIAAATLAKDDARVKELVKERDGLQEMIDGDPSRASEYPLDDARATLAVFIAQEKHAVYLADQYRQARAAWALHLASAWGARTDAAGVERLRAVAQAAYDELEEELIQLGYIRRDKKRTRDTKVAKARMILVCQTENLPIRRTDGHADPATTKCKNAAGEQLTPGHDDCVEHVCLDAEACEATGDGQLEDYAEISTLKKVLTNDLKALLQGVTHPVHTRYGFAETGRTTSSKPPIQNLRRLVGIRECFVPRPGWVYFAADYPALEMYTWAQCCASWLGQSKLAEALNAGLDPHLIAAGVILGGVPYAEVLERYEADEQEVIDIRQLAKVGNFGWPGGMGPPTMLRSAKKQMSKEACERLGLDLPLMVKFRAQWEETWPEAKPYFDRIKAMGRPYPERYRATTETLFTKRTRGGASYCATANNGFQALGADCAKEALWRVCEEQYDKPASALFNSRTVFFVHDEIIGEAREEVAPEAAQRLADVMVEAANMYLPNVPIPRAKLKPLLMRRWSKKAKPLFDASGRLVPWDVAS